jgi:hypothetical protein
MQISIAVMQVSINVMQSWYHCHTVQNYRHHHRAD